MTVKYESLVKSPEQEMKRICAHLGLDFEPEVINYGDGNMSEWHFGDPQKVYEHSRPQTSSLKKWTDIDNAQEWKVLCDYATYLGSGVFEKLDYDYQSCLRTLESQRPSSEKMRYAFCLDWLLRDGKESRARWEHHAVRTAQRTREQGLSGAARYMKERVVSRITR